MTEETEEGEVPAGQALFEHAIGNLQIDRELAFRFLAIFARFEYALKAAKFVFQGENERDLSADFDCFARVIATPFQEKLEEGDAGLVDARAYYHEHPPQKQIWNGDEPDWKEALPQNRTASALLLILIRRVRNNLFHGGKGWKRPDVERDHLLMAHGLRLLEVMIACEPAVSAEYSTYQ